MFLKDNFEKYNWKLQKPPEHSFIQYILPQNMPPLFSCVLGTNPGHIGDQGTEGSIHTGGAIKLCSATRETALCTLSYQINKLGTPGWYAFNQAQIYSPIQRLASQYTIAKVYSCHVGMAKVHFKVLSNTTDVAIISRIQLKSTLFGLRLWGPISYLSYSPTIATAAKWLSWESPGSACCCTFVSFLRIILMVAQLWGSQACIIAHL